MEQQEKTPNWMKYPPLLRFYQTVQESGCGLEPDPKFLEDPKLGRYQEYQLKNLEISQTIKDFLTEVGLPDQFRPFRLPSEEKSGKLVYLGTLYWVSCLRNEVIQKKKYLVIGENRHFIPCATSTKRIDPDGTEYTVCRNNKMEHCAYVVVELKTGGVWSWTHDSFGDELQFINSSLEQYLLSMACWQSFYAGFSQQITSYLKKNKDKREWEYVNRNRRRLYAPFLNCMKALDPPALRKRYSYWKYSCDTTLI